VSGTAEIWLGIIALAVLVMAGVQVGAIVAGLRVARRVEQIATDLDTSIKPLVANLTTMSAEASRAASLAAAQVDKLDRMFNDLTARAEQTLAMAQRLIKGPATEGMAIVAGIRAAMTAIRSIREATRRRAAARSATFEEEEESLFIG
jgi:hypothetical protein